MKISILGGTGGLGQGLALRWIQSHDIIVGSRLKQKAKETIINYNEILKKFGKNNKGKLIAATNEEAVKNSEIIVFSTPPEYTVKMVKNLKKHIPKDALIISPVVPMKVESGIFSYKVDMMQKHGVSSAAEAISPCAGKQEIQSTPSAFSILAITRLPFIDIFLYLNLFNYNKWYSFTWQVIFCIHIIYGILLLRIVWITIH